MSIKDITIIITSFRSEKPIRECLKQINKECKVINVENSNNKAYKNKIENEFNNVECILSGENIGYARGNNIGLRKTKTKFALILNPDAKLLHDTLGNFILTAKKKPDFAIIGPGIIDNNSNVNNKKFLFQQKLNKITSYKSRTSCYNDFFHINFTNKI